MFSVLFGASAIDEQIDKATSENLPSGQEDMALNLEICDQIRCKQIGAKEAASSLRRRLRNPNPNIQLHTLSLIDTCVKNGGNHFLVEVSSREFMDELVSILKQPSGLNPQVHLKLLELIQIWAESFKGRPELSYACQIYGALKAQGYKFPPKQDINPVMIDTQTAPEWTDSDICMRCRSAFTFTNRKHHCRNCGQIFCHSCSSNNLPLPHFGISEPVRVCTGCYFRVKKISVAPASLSLSEFMASEVPRNSSIDSTAPILTSGAIQAPVENDMDEDLRRAIELSLQDSKKTLAPARVTFSQPLVTSTQEEPSEDADLAAAIAASLQDLDLKQTNTRSSYPDPAEYRVSERFTQVDKETYSQPEAPSNNLTEREIQNIVLFSKLVDTIQTTNGYISDPSIHALYSDLGKLVPKLSFNLQDVIHKHQSFLEMQNKLTSAVKLYDSLLEQSINKNYHSEGYSLKTYGPYSSLKVYDSHHHMQPTTASSAIGYNNQTHFPQPGTNPWNENYYAGPVSHGIPPSSDSSYYQMNHQNIHLPQQAQTSQYMYPGPDAPSSHAYPQEHQRTYPLNAHAQHNDLASHPYQASSQNGILYSQYPAAGAPPHGGNNSSYIPKENQLNPQLANNSQPPVADAPLIDL